MTRMQPKQDKSTRPKQDKILIPAVVMTYMVLLLVIVMVKISTEQLCHLNQPVMVNNIGGLH